VSGGGETKLGYQAHCVVDGGKARVILNVLVTPSEVSENRLCSTYGGGAFHCWNLWPDHVTGDAKYGTAENMSTIESVGIRAYVAPHESGVKGKAFVGKGKFAYDPKRDLYLCPAGEELHRAGKSGKGIRYRANASACRDCSLKERCTPSEGGAQHQPLPQRRVRGAGAGVPTYGALQEGDAKAQGVDRAFVCRGQRLARDEEVPTTEAREGKRRSFADRLGSERQAAARLWRRQTEETGSGGSLTPANYYRL
jgi:hypothetical protein